MKIIILAIWFFIPFLLSSAHSKGPCLDQPGHIHGAGGGFVANSAQVDSDVFVGINAQVCDQVVISGKNIFIDGESIISNQVVIESHSSNPYAIRIVGRSSVAGNAHVTTLGTGKVVINGNSLISDNTQLMAQDGKIIIGNNAKLLGAPHLMVESGGSVNIVEDAEVSGDAQLVAKNSSQISVGFKAIVTEQARLSARRLGSIKVLNNALIAGHALLELPEDFPMTPFRAQYVSLIYIAQTSRVLDDAQVVSRTGGKIYLAGSTKIRDVAKILARGINAYLVISGQSDLSHNVSLSVVNEQRFVDLIRP